MIETALAKYIRQLVEANKDFTCYVDDSEYRKDRYVVEVWECDKVRGNRNTVSTHIFDMEGKSMFLNVK